MQNAFLYKILLIRFLSIFVVLMTYYHFSIITSSKIYFCILIPHFYLAFQSEMRSPRSFPNLKIDKWILLIIIPLSLLLPIKFFLLTISLVPIHLAFSDIYVFQGKYQLKFKTVDVFHWIRILLGFSLHFYILNYFLFPNLNENYFKLYLLIALSALFIVGIFTLKLKEFIPIFLFELIGVATIYLLAEKPMYLEMGVYYHVMFWFFYISLKYWEQGNYVKLKKFHLDHLKGTSVLAVIVIGLSYLELIYPFNFDEYRGVFGLWAAFLHLFTSFFNSDLNPHWIKNISFKRERLS